DEVGWDAAMRMSVVMEEGLMVERAQAILHPLDRVTERHQVDLARDGRDLDRDVLDVFEGQEREVGVEPARGLGLAEDRLVELVQIETDPGRSALGQVAVEL